MADLPRHIVSRGGGFLLTSIMDSRPHVAHLPFEVASADGQVQLRARVGRTAYGNCGQQPAVTVLWPAVSADPTAASSSSLSSAPTSESGGRELDHYSLIVDGEARLDGPEHVVVVVTGAVFHRPVPVAPSP